jgi:hypothetical protein
MAKSTIGSDQRKQTAATLAPGIHPAHIDVRAGKRYGVRTLGGVRLEAALGAGVEPAFAEECLREHRTVLVTPGEHGGAVILGALQTTRALSRDDIGTLRAHGRRLEIDAEEGLVLRVGNAALIIDQHGALKLTGNKLNLDIAQVVRVLAAACELP